MAKTLHFESDANMAFDAASRLPMPPANMSFAMELLTGPVRLYRLAQAEWQHRRAMKELYDLDDRMLRDIGLGRSGDRIRNRQRSRECIALARISRHECQTLFDRGEPRSGQ